MEAAEGESAARDLTDRVWLTFLPFVKTSKAGLIRVATLLVVAAVDVGCATTSGTVAVGPPRAMPSGQTWVGCWETDFGGMQLRDDSGQVRGVYAYGSILGLLSETGRDGNHLRLHWTETSDGVTPTAGGAALFAMDQGGQSFVGRWGRGSSDSDGGAWTGRRKPCK